MRLCIRPLRDTRSPSLLHTRWESELQSPLLGESPKIVSCLKQLNGSSLDSIQAKITPLLGIGTGVAHGSDPFEEL
jgi:hypothetical protein